MRQIFSDIYDVKRLQPGVITSWADGADIFIHDCSTLGGNSGSPVLDLETHQVVGLHFGGRYLSGNNAIPLWRLTDDELLRSSGVTLSCSRRGFRSTMSKSSTTVWIRSRPHQEGTTSGTVTADETSVTTYRADLPMCGVVEGEVLAVLRKSERDQIETEFASMLAAQANPRSLITVVFKTAADSLLLNLPASAMPREIASFTIAECLVSRWTLDPSLLEMLIVYLVETRGVGSLDEVLTRVKQHIDPNPTIYDAAWVIGQRPFFDRRDFRQRVRRLIEDNGRPILRVSAVADSFGRTYSRYFLEHLEDCSPDAVHVLPVELSVGTGPSYQVIDLLDAVDAQLGADDPIPSRMSSSYPLSAALWILKQLMKRPGRWLVVLDGFGQKNSAPRSARQSRPSRSACPPAVSAPHTAHPPRLPAATAWAKSRGHARGNSPAPGQDRPGRPGAMLGGLGRRQKTARDEGMGVGELEKLADGMLGRAPLAGRERLETLNTELSKLYGF